MSSKHVVEKSLGKKIATKVPFGVGQRKPHHFIDMAKIMWQNKDNLGYAWKVLSKGVCDGCALGVSGFHDWTIEGTHLCMTRLNLLRLNTMDAMDETLLEDVSKLKEMSNRDLRELGRLPYPMVREGDAKGFRRISWDEANERMAKKLRVTDPKRFAFFVTSRGVTNEVYYVAQKAARLLGTNNVDNAARLCHSPSTAAMKKAIGVAATTCSYTDWFGTDLIIFFGSNPANDQPVTTKYLHEAKLKGTKIVMVNPYLEPGMERYWVPSTAASALFGTDITDYWYAVNQGGDIAFLYGVLKILFESGDYDKSFVENNTEGFATFKKKVEEQDWDQLEKLAGLSRGSMAEFADLICKAKNAVLVWSMGITQHTYGADGVSMILNLALTQNWIGRDKCGVMPIRGHSSVQGGAEMGAYSTALPGGIPITKENVDALSKSYGFPVPEEIGLTTVEMLESCARGELDFLFSVGGNFLRTMPDPIYIREALANVPMRIHQDIILTDQMLIPAKEEVLLLPAKTRYEQDEGGISTNTERRIMFSPEIPRQVGEAKCEWKILRDLTIAVDPANKEKIKCEDGWKVREEIAEIVPFYKGCETLVAPGDQVQYGGNHLCVNGVFETPDEKGHFVTVAVPESLPPEGFFSVSTRRGKQFNTLIYDEIDPLNGAPRDAVLMNEEDAARLRVKTGDKVILSSKQGEMTCSVLLAPIAPTNLQIHWPEGNILIESGPVDLGGGVPDYTTFVEVRPVRPDGQGKGALVDEPEAPAVVPAV